ncbi:enoyl-CoA hydratase family protein [Williamsia sp. 1135]|uniref:enoyl-CoA hydratase family protein n=1 Tax=Williamsia sp. 1135 TaxID=1889262 RepID=UPI000A106652|nr:enoyl-CoA hydratase family protein [Williamsia sp. 1135]ORM32129.1 enoyl-CoA hydratase [Williamsia sp. 1135]
MSDVVQYAVDAGIATITFDSPANRNAISAALVEQLSDRLVAVRDDDAVRAVVLTHTGGTFCAGADLSEAGRARPDVMIDLMRSILELPKPVIGRIDGHVRAGGFGFVGACDLVAAGPKSTFALTEARIGVAPAMISLTVLPRLTSRAASRYFLTGEKFDAATAQDIGLITAAVTETAELDEIVTAWCADLRKGSPQGLAASKALTTATTLREFDRDAVRLVEQSATLFASDEARAGMTAFLTKQPPPWVTS